MMTAISNEATITMQPELWLDEDSDDDLGDCEYFHLYTAPRTRLIPAVYRSDRSTNGLHYLVKAARLKPISGVYGTFYNLFILHS